MSEAICLIRFRHSYILSPDCIGRKISFCFSDISIASEIIECRILFPCRDPYDQFGLISPIPERKLGVVVDWGKVNYSEPNDVPYVNGIVVILRSKSKLVDTQCSKTIDTYANKILKVLRCIYPYAVDRTSIPNPYTEKTIVKSGNVVLAGSITIRFDKNISKKWIELGGILNAFRYINDEVSLPLQLFDYALDSKSALDYRVCVIYCAALIEILLKRDLEKQIEKSVSMVELRNKIIKEANSYTKIMEYLKCFSSGPTLNSDELFKKRNRIMHGGYSPTEVDAQNSLILANKYIDYYESVFG